MPPIYGFIFGAFAVLVVLIQLFLSSRSGLRSWFWATGASALLLLLASAFGYVLRNIPASDGAEMLLFIIIFLCLFAVFGISIYMVIESLPPRKGEQT